ncbi:MAG: VCBS repeat-containing protein, partial [Cyclobacteriaceae bacterium]|nr:VCBS repeat-containing protein [Cyclobacteriaceae bacterium]
MFTKLPAEKTRIKFKNIIKDSETLNVLNNAYWYNGGRVATGNVNNDGLPDIYFTGNPVNCRLYINKENLKFKEIAKKAGVLAGGLWNTGTCMADVNGDGYLDIYVCRSAAKDPEKRRNLLFINNGDLNFNEKGRAYGLDDPSYSTYAALFDYDRDGDLDAYILNHSLDEYASFNDHLNTLKKTRSEVFADKLFRKDGEKFVNVSKEAGLINNVLGFGLDVAVLDVNAGHWPDIYISNDYNEEDYLYINQQNGSFKESIRESMGHVSLSSMGNDSGDF